MDLPRHTGDNFYLPIEAIPNEFLARLGDVKCLCIPGKSPNSTNIRKCPEKVPLRKAFDNESESIVLEGKKYSNSDATTFKNLINDQFSQENVLLVDSDDEMIARGDLEQTPVKTITEQCHVVQQPPIKTRRHVDFEKFRHDHCSTSKVRKQLFDSLSEDQNFHTQGPHRVASARHHSETDEDLRDEIKQYVENLRESNFTSPRNSEKNRRNQSHDTKAVGPFVSETLDELRSQNHHSSKFNTKIIKSIHAKHLNGLDTQVDCRKRKRSDLECIDGQERGCDEKCTCSTMEGHFLQMSECAYRNIRRKDATPAAFEQFKRELTQTNDIIKESMDILRTIQEFCEHRRKAEEKTFRDYHHNFVSHARQLNAC